ncbi:alpha/beta hydrolase [Neisseriaceae bacterium JH1-16]|nr:alpha/beta hydrolase [Neisseriaceae bacterium JH1-16]
MEVRLELILEAAKGAQRELAPLLFVHGAFCGAWYWQVNLMPWLAERGIDCWALSLGSHGGSADHEGRNTLGTDDYVADV